MMLGVTELCSVYSQYSIDYNSVHSSRHWVHVHNYRARMCTERVPVHAVAPRKQRIWAIFVKTYSIAGISSQKEAVNFGTWGGTHVNRTLHNYIYHMIGLRVVCVTARGFPSQSEWFIYLVMFAKLLLKVSLLFFNQIYTLLIKTVKVSAKSVLIFGRNLKCSNFQVFTTLVNWGRYFGLGNWSVVLVFFLHTKLGSEGEKWSSGYPE